MRQGHQQRRDLDKLLEERRQLGAYQRIREDRESYSPDKSKAAAEEVGAMFPSRTLEKLRIWSASGWEAQCGIQMEWLTWNSCTRRQPAASPRWRWHLPPDSGWKVLLLRKPSEELGESSCFQRWCDSIRVKPSSLWLLEIDFILAYLEGRMVDLTSSVSASIG